MRVSLGNSLHSHAVTDAGNAVRLYLSESTRLNSTMAVAKTHTQAYVVASQPYYVA
jgi:hypothetical protein